MCEVCRLFSLVPDLEVATREYEVYKRFEVCVSILSSLAGYTLMGNHQCV